MLMLNRSPYLGLPVMVGIPGGTRRAAPANLRVDCLCLHDKSAPDHVDDGICQYQLAAGKLCEVESSFRVGGGGEGVAALLSFLERAKQCYATPHVARAKRGNDWLTILGDRCSTRRVKNTSMCKGSTARRTRAARPLMQAQVLDLRARSLHFEQTGLFLPTLCKFLQ